MSTSNWVKGRGGRPVSLAVGVLATVGLDSVAVDFQRPQLIQPRSLGRGRGLSLAGSRHKLELRRRLQEGCGAGEPAAPPVDPVSRYPILPAWRAHSGIPGPLRAHRPDATNQGPCGP